MEGVRDEPYPIYPNSTETYEAEAQSGTNDAEAKLHEEEHTAKILDTRENLFNCDYTSDDLISKLLDGPAELDDSLEIDLMLSPLLPDSILDYTWQDFDDVLANFPDVILSSSMSESQTASRTNSGLTNDKEHICNVQQSKTETQQPSSSTTFIMFKETVPSVNCKQNFDSNVISDQVNKTVSQRDTTNIEIKACNSRSSATRYSLRDRKTKVRYQEEEDVNEDHLICK